MQNPHEVLGVGPNATPDEIKSAFKKLAMQHHPDRNGGSDESTVRFQEINEAYQALMRGPQPQQGHPQHEFDDFFNEQMARMFREHQRETHRQTMNGDILSRVEIGFEEVFRGCEIDVRSASTGQTLNVKVPPGIGHGQRLRVTGAGFQRDTTYPPGDLYVEIHVRPHERFRRQDAMLIADIPLDSLDAILGGEVEVVGIDDEIIIVPYQPGIQHGQYVSVPARGLPIIGDQKPPQRGDLIVVFHLVTPVELTERHRELVNRLSKILPSENPNS